MAVLHSLLASDDGEMADAAEEADDGSFDVSFNLARCRMHQKLIGISLKKDRQDAALLDLSKEKQEKLVQHIRKHFKMKECCRYVSATNGNSHKSNLLTIGPPCHCGEYQVNHFDGSLAGGSAASSPRSRVDGDGSRRSSLNNHTSFILHPRLAEQLVRERSTLASATSQQRSTSSKTKDVVATSAAPQDFTHQTSPIIHVEDEGRTVQDAGMPKPSPFHGSPRNNWSEGDCIKEMSTNAFGLIEFTNDESGSKPAKYCRMSYDTPMKQLLELMVDHWRMTSPSRPSLVLAVVGGAKNFSLEGKRKDVFNRGLIKLLVGLGQGERILNSQAAISTNAWVVTGGFHMGVMRAVGEAVAEGQANIASVRNSKGRIRCIGVASWGYVQNREDLISTNSQGLWPATYHADPILRTGKPASLDPNHTHFLLIDDGYRNFFRTNVEDFRAKLVRHMAAPSKADDDEQCGLGIPVVVLLIEGGIDAIRFVHESIQHGIPVVVCNGTGRAANLLAYAHSHLTTVGNQDESSPDESTGVHPRRFLADKERQILKDKFKIAFAKSIKLSDRLAQQNMEEQIDRIIRCVQNDDMITVFDVNKDDDLDLAILSAVLKGKGARPLDQLRLALKWNRSDVAEEKIFQEGSTWRPGELDEILAEALIVNKPDFTQLLLQHGVIVKDFLTVDRLRSLYNKAHSGGLVKKLLLENAEDEQHLYLSDVNVVLEQLLRRRVEQGYSLDKCDGLQKEDAMRTNSKLAVLEAANDLAISSSLRVGNARFGKPFKELFLWAVLMNRPEMARFFWERSESPIMNALVATQLYRSLMKSITAKDHELGKYYKRKQKEFEMMAIQVLNQAFMVDPEKALVLVERSHEQWGNLTCLQVGAVAHDKIFFGLLCPLYIMFGMHFDKNTINASRTELTIWQRLKTFYCAPATRFCMFTILQTTSCQLHAPGPTKAKEMMTKHKGNDKKISAKKVSYLIFMVLYGFVLMFDLRFEKFSAGEVILHIWVASFCFNILKEFIWYLRGTHNKQFLYNGIMDSMFHSFWFKLELAALTLHVIGFALRCLPNTVIAKENFSIVRVVFCTSGMAFYFKLLRVYMASPYLGPKLFVIRRMLRDVMMFLLIMIVFMLAYAIASQAMTFPNRDYYPGIFKDILYYPYWQLYGELSLDETINANIEGCTDGVRMNEAGQWCPTSHWFVAVCLAAYLLIGNILLINMLIAIFTHVFEEVQSNANVIWKYEMWLLTVEFDNMPILPFPLTILEHVVDIVHFIVCCGCVKPKQRPDSTVWLTTKQIENLLIFEKECMHEVLRTQKKNRSNEVNSQIQLVNNKMDNIIKKVEEERKASQLNGSKASVVQFNHGSSYHRQSSTPLFQPSKRVSAFMKPDEQTTSTISPLHSARDETPGSERHQLAHTKHKTDSEITKVFAP